MPRLLKSRAFLVWFRFVKNLRHAAFSPSVSAHARVRIAKKCLMLLMQRLFSARWVRFGKRNLRSRVLSSPRSAGTTVERCVQRDRHASPAAFHLFTFQIARSLGRLPVNRVKLRSSPVALLGRGGSPVFLSSISLEGDGAPTRRSARIAPGDVRQRPDHDARLSAQRCTRAYRRANAASSACASSTLWPARSTQSLTGFRASPAGRFASSPSRRCRSRSPPHERLRKAPLEHGTGRDHFIVKVSRGKVTFM